LFLWHVPLIVWLNGHDLLPGGFLIRLVIIWPLALAAGATSWYLLERPLVRRERRLPRESARGRDERSDVPSRGRQTVPRSSQPQPS